MFPSHEVVDATLQMRSVFRRFREKHARDMNDDELRQTVRDRWPYFKDKDTFYVLTNCVPVNHVSNFTQMQTGLWLASKRGNK